MGEQINLADLSAEQVVLGALMLNTSRFDAVREVLGAGDFYHAGHRLMFAAIEAVALTGAMADAVSVADVLARRGQLAECGDLGYLAEVALNTPSAANVLRYARIVADRSLRRRALAAGQSLADSALEAEDVEVLIESALNTISSLSPDSADDLSSAAEVAQAGLDFVMDRYDNPEQMGGVATGFADVDQRLQGMKGGDLVIVAGRPAMGKSMYSMMLANHAAAHGVVLYFSLEMGKQQIGLRQLAALGGADASELQSGRLQDETLVTCLPEAVRRVSDLRLLTDFRAQLTVQQIRARAREVKRRHGLTLIMIDYLQLIEASRRSDNRSTEMGEISRQLKLLARELDVPVVALSQLSRKVEERANKRPMMSDLRESGAIEQDADIVQMLYRDEYYNPDSADVGTVEVITVKQRNGPTGTDYLAYQGAMCRMLNLAPQAKAEMARERAAPRRRPVFSGLD